jgi:hypothetical protein
VSPGDLVLPVLLLAVWVTSWWLGTRRFRLWFALLAPWVCVAGIILAAFGSLSQADASCSMSCDGSAVQRWAAEVDSPSATVVWLGRNSVAGLGLALALTGITLIVEYGARSAVPNPDVDGAGFSLVDRERR